jgi:nitroreductase
MDILEIISTRKSIRNYSVEPIPDELIDRILEAARWAPTGENHQPWRLIVIRNPETKKKIGELARIGTGSFMTTEYCMGRMSQFEGIRDKRQRERVGKFMVTGEVSAFLGRAPLIIAVCGRCSALDTPYDLSACIENMLLEAHSLGLGACWANGPVAAIRNEIKMKELLGIPQGMGKWKLLAMISFGWPERPRKHPRPKLPLKEIVYWEKFGERERPESTIPH